ncbi:Hypothetical predicted protein, partial [Paramuricea clavata]
MVLEVAEAKLARTSAKRVFNRNVKKLVDSINSKDTAALIESRFKDLKQLWDDVQRKHEGYIESLENSKTTYDVEQEDGWIDEMDKVYDDVLRQKLAYFETVEEDQREIERQQEQISKEKEDQIRKKEGDKAIFRAEQARKVEEIAFRQEVENLEEALAAEIDKPNPAASMLETARTELKRQLEECKRVNGEYVLLLDAETAGYEIAWFTSLQKIYSQISKKIGDVIQRKSDTKGNAMRGSTMKLERMKLPQFSGNIRDYPRFRSDFEKQILPELESGKVAYVLKSCLEGEAFDAIYNLDDD